MNDSWQLVYRGKQLTGQTTKKHRIVQRSFAIRLLRLSFGIMHINDIEI